MYFYLFTVAGLLIGLVPLALIRLLSKNGKLIRIFECVLTSLLILVFIMRTQSYISGTQDGLTDIREIIGFSRSDKSFSSYLVGVCSAALIWGNITVALILMFRNFFDFKVIKNLAKYVAPIITVLSIGFFYPICEMLQGDTHLSALVGLLGVEQGLELAFCIYYWIVDHSFEKNVKDIFKFIGIFLLLSITTMPPYMLQFLFGFVKFKGSFNLDDFSRVHRALIYLAIILPVIIYFTLRNKPENIIRFSLTFISCGTLTNFMAVYNYTNLTQPWSWPLHICNTAMILMPICTIFKTKRLFYFTLFINVAGALFAMLLPNYSEGLNIFAENAVRFYYNHYIAFFMPILCVALKLFERPKLKHFFYSNGFFALYFLLVLFLNAYFTSVHYGNAEGSTVDFFFINSDFIADKLGRWAEDLFAFTANITLNGHVLVFHPAYQVIYYFAYVLITLACWFIYQLFFDIADRHGELHNRLKAIKLDQYALSCQMGERGTELPMDPNAGIKFELKHFSKRYASSKIYAVKDANLEVHGGEIFGFLGPNGAGKSTIIKSTVGIQPISEGNISICGYDVKTQSVQAKQLIGFVPDHYALYEKLSGREYVNYIADIYGVSQEERDARLNKYIKLFQMEASIDNKIKTYSHGMKQKITIMSALVHNPRVWILDEPLTGLDPTSIYQVKECMKEHAKEGNIVFFSSHIIDIVEKLCERIAIIKKGEIQCVKTVKEIEQSGTTLEQFYLDTIGESYDDNLEEKSEKENEPTIQGEI